MFHFPRCRPPRLWIQRGVAGIALRGCPIRRPTGHGPPAPRRGISPLAASFVAIRCQGIRHAPEKLGRKTCSRGRASGLPMPLREAPRRAGAGSPFCIAMLPSKSILSFASGCQRAPSAPCAEGMEIVFSGMVGAPGLEPGTSSLSEKRSNQLSYAPEDIGGAEGTRTHDILLAKQALYQLSYGPLGGPPAPRESSGAIQAEHRPRPELAGRPL